MTPATRAFLDRALAELAKVNAVAKVLTGSPITGELAAVVPDLATIVADLRLVEGAIDKLEAWAPRVEEGIDLLDGLRALVPGFHMQSADGETLARLEASHGRGG